MAELTTLEEKLAEVTGLAKAAQEATQKVEGLVDDEQLLAKLQQMREEAEETEQRCTAARRRARRQEDGDPREGAGDQERGRGDDEDLPRRGLRRPGRVRVPDDGRGRRGGHWEILGKLNEKAGEEPIRELVEWALPIQERHFSDVREGSLTLAADEDPYA